MTYNKIVQLNRGFRLEVKPAELLSNYHLSGALASMFTAYFKTVYSDETDFIETIGSIFNELIENAIKYSLKEESICLLAFENKDGCIHLELKNFTNEYNYNTYKTYSEFILDNSSGNVMEKYIKLIYKNIGIVGGIGIIKIILDYDAHFEFEFNSYEYEKYQVTTRCVLDINKIFMKEKPYARTN